MAALFVNNFCNLQHHLLSIILHKPRTRTPPREDQRPFSRMSLPPNHVSKTTWLDLLDCTYDAFIEELSYLHATLQKQASGNITDGLFCFVGQVWWYHIDRTGSTTTVGESDMSDVWVCLENFEVYDEMIDIFCNDYHDENVALIITNVSLNSDNIV